MKKRRKKKWNEEQLIEAVQNCYCLTDVLRQLGLKTAGGNHKSIKSWIFKYQLDTTHFVPYKLRLKGLEKRKVCTLEEIFCENSAVNRATLRRAAFKVIDYKCSCGNIGEWVGLKLTLQLDHKNGVGNDNRKENLRWLCPNCHSQTESFAGKSSTFIAE